jgi:hypothetical protein
MIKNLRWFIVAFVVTSLLVLVAFLVPDTTLPLYFKGLYPIIRKAFSLLHFCTPVPLVWLLLCLLPVLFYFWIPRQEGGFKRLIIAVMKLIIVFYCAFWWLWGFNYACVDALSVSKEKQLERHQLLKLGKYAAHEANHYRNKIQIPFEYWRADDPIFDHITSIPFNGLLRRCGIAGIFIPFTNEPLIDGSFFGSQKLWVAHHETAHREGFAEEARADFEAWQQMLAFTSTDSINLAMHRYSAWFEVWLTVKNECYQSIADRDSLEKMLSPAVREDLNKIRTQSKNFPPFFPGVSQKLNDMYLKSLGIESGILSYDQFILGVWNVIDRDSSFR